jgi:hypothetical protein
MPSPLSRQAIEKLIWNILRAAIPTRFLALRVLEKPFVRDPMVAAGE